MREWPDRLDEILDSALASYGQSPEREGLERRVLAKVNERAMRTRPLRRWVITMTGAAAAVVCCLFWQQTPKKTIEPHPAVVAAAKAPLARQIPTPAANTPKRSTAPKLSRFPTPSPMSSEERALLRLATGDPQNIPRELTHAGDPIEPLQIAAIEIKPLE